MRVGDHEHHVARLDTERVWSASISASVRNFAIASERRPPTDAIHARPFAPESMASWLSASMRLRSVASPLALTA